jgi:hypothetical protein
MLRGTVSKPPASYTTPTPVPAPRYFSTWKHKGVVEMMPLPPQAGLGPQLVAFGDGVLRLQDTVLAGEAAEGSRQLLGAQCFLQSAGWS